MLTKKTAFLLGTSNLFGLSYFEAALGPHVLGPNLPIVHSLNYISIISISDVFFSVDCMKTLKCIAKKCGTLGEKDDYCRDYKDCRLLPYYLSLILFSNFNPSFSFSFFYRGDGYCDKRKNVCREKKKPGQNCKSDSECLNSICLESQKEPVSQKGNNRGFGFRWVFIQ